MKRRPKSPQKHQKSRRHLIEQLEVRTLLAGDLTQERMSELEQTFAQIPSVIQRAEELTGGTEGLEEFTTVQFTDLSAAFQSLVAEPVGALLSNANPTVEDLLLQLENSDGEFEGVLLDIAATDVSTGIETRVQIDVRATEVHSNTALELPQVLNEVVNLTAIGDVTSSTRWTFDVGVKEVEGKSVSYLTKLEPLTRTVSAEFQEDQLAAQIGMLGLSIGDEAEKDTKLAINYDVTAEFPVVPTTIEPLDLLQLSDELFLKETQQGSVQITLVGNVRIQGANAPVVIDFSDDLFDESEGTVSDNLEFLGLASIGQDDPATVVAAFEQLSYFFAQLPNTGIYGTVLPFGSAPIGARVDLETFFRANILNRLRAEPESPNDPPALLFSTFDELEILLGDVISDFRFDSDSQELRFTLSISDFGQTFSEVAQLPDVGPFTSFQSPDRVTHAPHHHFDLDIAFDLLPFGARFGELTRDTMVHTTFRGEGFETSLGDDMRFLLNDGTTFQVDLDYDETTTLGTLIDRIQSAANSATNSSEDAPAFVVTTEHAALKFVDKTTGTNGLRVQPVNRSRTLLDLGLIGTGTTEEDSGNDLILRSALLHGDEVGEHIKVTRGSITTKIASTATHLTASAQWGPSSVQIKDGTLTGSSEIKFDLAIPTDAAVTVNQLIDRLDSDQPGIENASATATATLDLPTTALEGGIDATPSNTDVYIQIGDYSDLGSAATTISDSEQSGALVATSSIAMKEIIEALSLVLPQLEKLSEDGVLTERIPGLGNDPFHFVDLPRAFAQLLNQVIQQQPSSLQELNSIANSLPHGSIGFSFDDAPGAEALRLSLQFDIPVSTTAHPFLLYLPDTGLDPFTIGMESAVNVDDLNGQLEVNVRANGNLKLDLGILLHNSEPVLYDTSAMAIELAAESDAITLDTLLGLSQARVLGGSLRIGERASTEGELNPLKFMATVKPQPDGWLTLNGTNELFDVEQIGPVSVRLPWQLPQSFSSESPTTEIKIGSIGDKSGTVTITGDDLDSILLQSGESSSLDHFSEGWNHVISQLGESLERRVFNQSLPLVGRQLRPTFFYQLRDQLLDNLNQLDSAPSIQSLRQAMFDAFGPGGLNWLQSEDGSYGPQMIRLDVVGRTTFFSLDLETPMVDVNEPIQIDLGVPGLGLDIDASVPTGMKWKVPLRVGINPLNGVFIATNDSDPIAVEIKASADHLNDTPATLGGLYPYRVTSDSNKPNQLFGVMRIDLLGRDGKLTAADFSQSSTRTFDHSFKSPTLSFGWKLKTALPEDAAAPKFQADLSLSWEFDRDTRVKETAPRIAFQNVEVDLVPILRNMVAPMAAEINRTIGALDFLEKLNGGIPWLSDVVGGFRQTSYIEAAKQYGGTADVGDFEGAWRTLGEIASNRSISDPNISEAIHEATGKFPYFNLLSLKGETWIKIGSFMVDGDVARGLKEGDLIQQADPFPLAPASEEAEASESIIGQIIELAKNGSGQSLSAALGFLVTQLLPGKQDQFLSTLVFKEFETKIEPIRFLFLEDATKSFQLMLGQTEFEFISESADGDSEEPESYLDNVLIDYPMPHLAYKLQLTIPFSILELVGTALGALVKKVKSSGDDDGGPGLTDKAKDALKKLDVKDVLKKLGKFLAPSPSFRIRLDVEARAGYRFGFDTTGLTTFRETQSVDSFFDGFFIDDSAGLRNQGLVNNLFESAGIGLPDEDPDEVSFVGGFGLNGGLGVPFVFDLSVNGGLFGGVRYDLDEVCHPTDCDGRIRQQDLELNRLVGDENIYDRSGTLEVRVDFSFSFVAVLDINANIVTMPFLFPLPKEPASSPPQLATQHDSTLFINIGERIDQLGTDLGTSEDETVGIGVDEFNKLVVSAFGYTQTFSGIDKIVVDGGSGDDTILISPDVKIPALIHGGDGHDRIEGGSGDDTIFGGAGQDTILGGQGIDHLNGDGGQDSISGDEGNDLIQGGPGFDWLFGNDGADRIEGGDGADTIGGGNDDDIILGGPGDDLLIGNRGNDSIVGGDGSDHLEGSDNADTLKGGKGSDSLFGEQGPDQLFGDDADDQLLGGSGNDELSGGPGNDLLLGDANNDIIRGEAGDDIVLGGGGSDSLYGGSGNDEIFAANSSEGSKFEALHFIDGGTGNDTIFGDHFADSISAGDGNDTIHALGGVDVVDAGSGDDSVFGGWGVDRIYGGPGNDMLLANNGIADFSDPVDSWHELVGGSGIDTIHGHTGADRIYGDGVNSLEATEESIGSGDVILSFAGDDWVDAGEGNNVVESGSGSDTVLAGAGDDSIKTESGDDQVEAGNGSNFVVSGSGNDSIMAGGQSDDIDAGDGDDFIIGGLGSDTLTGGAGNDVIFGGVTSFQFSDLDLRDTTRFTTAKDDTPEWLSFTHEVPVIVPVVTGHQSIAGDVLDGGNEIDGGSGSDLLFGGWEADQIRGGDGADYIDGGAGDDQIEAGDGRDIVLGGIGDDRIDGNAGFDLLYGNDGSDILFAGASETVDQPGQYLFGGPGNDTLYAHANNTGELTLNGDHLLGGNGRDTLMGNVRREILIGGSGSDILFGDAVSGPNYDTNTSAEMGAADLLVGGGGEDQLMGQAGNDEIWGGPDSDYIVGSTGSDTQYGGSGIDVFVFEPEGLRETIHGHFGDQPGNATPDDNATDRLAIQGTLGDDTILLESGTEDSANTLRIRYNDITASAVWMSDGDPWLEQIYIAGLAGNDKVGFAGAEDVTVNGMITDLNLLTSRSDDFVTVLDGNSGDDTLLGTVGRDRLDGGPGSDQLFGLAGSDRLWGDQGDGRSIDHDQLYAGGGDDDVIGGSGTNQLFAWSMDPRHGNEFGVFVDEAGKHFSDSGGGVRDLEVTGLNRMLGGLRDDELYGGTALDFLYGNGGNDTLYRADGTAFDSVDGGLAGQEWKDYARQSDKVWYIGATNADDQIRINYVTEPGVLADHHLVTRLTNNDGNYTFAANVRLDFEAIDSSGQRVWDPTDSVLRYDQLLAASAAQRIEHLHDLPHDSTQLEHGLLPGEGDYLAIVVDALAGDDEIYVGPTVQKSVWIDAGEGDDEVEILGGKVILPDKTEYTPGLNGLSGRNDSPEFAYPLSLNGTSVKFQGLTIDGPDDADWYRFSLSQQPTGGLLRLRSAAVADDLTLEVRTADGETIIVSGQRQAPIHALSLNVDYLVRVTSNRTPTIYELHFDFPSSNATTIDLASAPNPERRDVILGGPGNDKLNGGSGEDWIFGEAGDDILAGGFDRNASDLLFGGSGDDTFQILTDRLPLLGRQNASNFDAVTETFIPTYSDILIGDEGNDRVFYLGGDLDENGHVVPDYVAVKYNSVLQRYELTSLVWDTAQQAFLTGSNPDLLEQRFAFFATRDVEHFTVDTRRGNDVVRADGGFQFLNVAGTYDHSDFSEWGIDTNDHVLGGDNLQLQMSGGEGNDTLFGGPFNDTLLGGGGNDILVGSDGNDLINGDIGNDRIYGNEPPNIAAYPPSFKNPTNSTQTYQNEFATAELSRSFDTPAALTNRDLIRNRNASLSETVGLNHNQVIRNVQSITDFNGDGFADLLVESVSNSFILFGPVALSGESKLAEVADIIIDNAFFGSPATTQGDINENGLTDLVFTKIEPNNVVTRIIFGAAELSGSTSWPRDWNSQFFAGLGANSSGEIVIPRSMFTDKLGTSQASIRTEVAVHDLGRKADVLIAASTASGAALPGSDDLGQAYIFSGRTIALTQRPLHPGDARVQLRLSQDLGNMDVMFVGDTNGDGRTNLAVSNRNATLKTTLARPAAVSARQGFTTTNQSSELVIEADGVPTIRFVVPGGMDIGSTVNYINAQLGGRVPATAAHSNNRIRFVTHELGGVQLAVTERNATVPALGFSLLNGSDSFDIANGLTNAKVTADRAPRIIPGMTSLLRVEYTEGSGLFLPKKSKTVNVVHAAGDTTQTLRAKLQDALRAAFPNVNLTVSLTAERLRINYPRNWASPVITITDLLETYVKQYVVGVSSNGQAPSKVTGFGFAASTPLATSNFVSNTVPLTSNQYLIEVDSTTTTSSTPIFSIGDVNKDGFDDLAWQDVFTLKTVLGRDGIFTTSADSSITRAAILVDVNGDHDVNGDGRNDLIATGHGLFSGPIGTAGSLPYRSNSSTFNWSGIANSSATIVDLNTDDLADWIAIPSNRKSLLLFYGTRKAEAIPDSVLRLGNASIPGAGSFVVAESPGQPVVFGDDRPFSFGDNSELWFDFAILGDADVNNYIALSDHSAELLNSRGEIVRPLSKTISLIGLTAGQFYLRVVKDAERDFSIKMLVPVAGAHNLPSDRDYLIGGDGDDLIDGGRDLDSILGGNGDDQFKGESVELRDADSVEVRSIEIADNYVDSRQSHRDPYVKITSPALQKAIAESLELVHRQDGEGHYTTNQFRVSQLASITTLTLKSRVLDQLHHLKSLRSLDLYAAGLLQSDLQYLSSLRNLEELRLDFNPNITSLAPIANLVNLRTLLLSSSNVTYASSKDALSKMTKLERLTWPDQPSPVNLASQQGGFHSMKLLNLAEYRLLDAEGQVLIPWTLRGSNPFIFQHDGPGFYQLQARRLLGTTHQFPFVITNLAPSIESSVQLSEVNEGQVLRLGDLAAVNRKLEYPVLLDGADQGKVTIQDAIVELINGRRSISLEAPDGSRHELNAASLVATTTLKLADPASPSTGATYEVWVKPDQNINHGSTLGLISPIDDYSIVLKHRTWQLSGGGNLYPLASVEFDTWAHVAATFRPLGNGQVEVLFYLNGELVRTRSLPALERNHDATWINNGYRGQLAELRIWNRPLDQETIQANLDRAIASSAAGLVRYYRLNEGAGSQLIDSSLYPRHLQHTTEWSNEPPPPLDRGWTLSADGEYTLHVTAFDPHGESARLSQSFEVKNLAPIFIAKGALSGITGEPLSLSNLEVADAGGDRVVVTVDVVSPYGETSTLIQRELTPGAELQPVSESLGYVPSYSGLHELILTATDESGATTVNNHVVQVSPAVDIRFVPNAREPAEVFVGHVARFSSAGTSGAPTPELAAAIPASAIPKRSYRWIHVRPDDSRVEYDAADIAILPTLPGSHKLQLTVTDHQERDAISYSMTGVKEYTFEVRENPLKLDIPYHTVEGANVDLLAVPPHFENTSNLQVVSQTFAWTVHNADGTEVLKSDEATPVFRVPQQGNFHISLEYISQFKWDDQPYSITLSGGQNLTASNSAPIVELPASVSGREGVEIVIPFDTADPGPADSVTTKWMVYDEGDHVIVQGTDSPIRWTPLESGQYRFAVTASDEDDGTTDSQARILVEDFIPQVTVQPHSELVEGVAVEWTATFDSTVYDGPYTVEWTMGDGTDSQSFILDNEVRESKISHTYIEDGEYHVRVRIIDKDGVEGQAFELAPVVNQAPQILSAKVDGIAINSQLTSISGSFTDTNGATGVECSDSIFAHSGFAYESQYCGDVEEVRGEIVLEDGTTIPLTLTKSAAESQTIYSFTTRTVFTPFVDPVEAEAEGHDVNNPPVTRTKIVVMDDDGGRTEHELQIPISDGTAPTIEKFSISPDSGVADDLRTKDQQPELEFRFSRIVDSAASAVRVIGPNGDEVSGYSIEGNNTSTRTVRFNSPLNRDGIYRVLVDGSQVRDRANFPLSEGVFEFSFVIDTIAPELQASDIETYEPTPLLHGSLDNNSLASTVLVRVAGKEYPAPLDADGVWQSQIGDALAAGEYIVKAEATDLSGNVGSTEFQLEILEAIGWQNPVNPLDVDNDGQVSPVDALLVINRINRDGSGELPILTEPPSHFVDVTGENLLSPIDALQIINGINSGEGEADGESTGEPSDGQNNNENVQDVTVGPMWVPHVVQSYRRSHTTRDPNAWLDDIAADIDHQWRDFDAADLYGDEWRRFDR